MELRLTLTQFLSMMEASVLAEAMTTPGLSNSFTFLSSCTSCMVLVTPGVAPTLHDLERFKLLMRLDLPVLGKPTKGW